MRHTPSWRTLYNTIKYYYQYGLPDNIFKASLKDYIYRKIYGNKIKIDHEHKKLLDALFKT